jgi:hypothetical protein
MKTLPSRTDTPGCPAPAAVLCCQRKCWPVLWANPALTVMWPTLSASALRGYLLHVPRVLPTFAP